MGKQKYWYEAQGSALGRRFSGQMYVVNEDEALVVLEKRIKKYAKEQLGIYKEFIDLIQPNASRITLSFGQRPIWLEEI